MSAVRRYAAVQNTTASKERLMVMLLEAALRHMRGAIAFLETKDRVAAAPLLDKASQIVLELQATLKPEVAPKLCDDLIAIYTFTAARLARAIASGDPRDARQAERAFAPIVDGFARAVANAASAPGAAGTSGSP
jgi:flagellar secretion chaperone FliS